MRIILSQSTCSIMLTLVVSSGYLKGDGLNVTYKQNIHRYGSNNELKHWTILLYLLYRRKISTCQLSITSFVSYFIIRPDQIQCKTLIAVSDISMFFMVDGVYTHASTLLIEHYKNNKNIMMRVKEDAKSTVFINYSYRILSCQFRVLQSVPQL